MKKKEIRQRKIAQRFVNQGELQAYFDLIRSNGNYSQKCEAVETILNSLHISRQHELGYGTIFDIVEDYYQLRVEAIRTGFRADFNLRLAFSYAKGSSCELNRLNGSYTITIEVGLLVKLFLAAITVAQNGSKGSQGIFDPYDGYESKGWIEKFLLRLSSKPLAHYRCQRSLFNALDSSVFAILLPEERWRQLLAFQYFYIALEYLVWHESCHAISGDIEFIEKYQSEMPPEIYQLLESQADDYASQVLGFTKSSLILGGLRRHNYIQFSRWGLALKDIRQAEDIYVISHTILFSVYELAIRKGNSTAQHPDFEYRCYRAIRLFLLNFNFKATQLPVKLINSVLFDLHVAGISNKGCSTMKFDEKELRDKDLIFDELHNKHPLGQALAQFHKKRRELMMPSSYTPPDSFFGEQEFTYKF